MRHAMIRISQPEADWAEVPLQSASLPRGTLAPGMSMLNSSVRTARLGRELIVPRTNGSMQDGVLRLRFAILEADLIAVDPEAGEVRDILALEPHELASYLPRYVDFRCSDDGTMWIPLEQDHPRAPRFAFERVVRE